MGEMDEVVAEFLVESHEGLDRLERDLLLLEASPGSTEALSSVFRTVHTIKGTCAFLGFATLESVAHVGEGLLSKLRGGQLRFGPEVASALLALADALREMLTAIETTGGEGEGDYGALVELLTCLGRAEGPPAAAAAPPAVAAPPAEDAVPVPKPLGHLLVEAGHATPAQVEEAIARQAAGDLRHLGEILVSLGVIPPGAVVEALEQQHEAARAVGLVESSLRVDVGLLDDLMALVGELSLARDQLLRLVPDHRDPALVAVARRLDLITDELRQGAMRTRMQPIGSLWSKLPRVVRDLALSCGKQVRLEVEGDEVELDRTILDAIKDPLTHLVRNAIDHGIELPEQRVAAGKEPEGRLLLRAYHRGGQVNVEIADDGAGIDPERVRERAAAVGLVSATRAATLSERELFDLIFAPGFSTASAVTNVSGRGVGLDVVRTNVERIGGAVEVRSRPGAGARLRITIPLSLAIVPALIATSGGPTDRNGARRCGS